MSELHPGTIGADTWEGKYWGRNGVLARAKAKYEHSARELQDHVAWASSLHSALGRFRAGMWRDPRSWLPAFCAWLRLRRELKYMARAAWQIMPRGCTAKQRLFASANTAETMSSILCTWGLFPLIGSQERTDAAEALAQYAYNASNGNFFHHTPALAALTLAELYYAFGRMREADVYFRDALSRARRITSDVNQQARVWRGLARLTAKYRKKPAAVARIYLQKAERVQGTGADVQAKTAAVARRLG